jgi:hypothetical protein
MPKITVYRYKIFDEHSQSYMLSKSLATRRAIDAAGGVIIPETSEEVELDRLNADGIVVRKAADPAAVAKSEAPKAPDDTETSKTTTKPL